MPKPCNLKGLCVRLEKHPMLDCAPRRGLWSIRRKEPAQDGMCLRGGCWEGAWVGL